MSADQSNRPEVLGQFESQRDNLSEEEKARMKAYIHRFDEYNALLSQFGHAEKFKSVVSPKKSDLIRLHDLLSQIRENPNRVKRAQFSEAQLHGREERHTLQKLVDELINMGYLQEGQTNPNDRRQIYMTVTTPGRIALDTIEQMRLISGMRKVKQGLFDDTLGDNAELQAAYEFYLSLTVSDEEALSSILVESATENRDCE